MSSFYFDPKVLIGPPYRECPKCGAVEFGTDSISNNRLSRRCRGCRYAASQALPPIRKKVIYLDQMTYSGMAKTLDPVWAAGSNTQSPLWARLFDALERAFKLQLVVCPHSVLHEQESVLAGHPSMLRAVYEHLGNGTSFVDPSQLHRHQLTVAFRAVLAGAEPRYELPDRLVLYGQPHEWMERLRLSVNIDLAPKPEEQQRTRSRAADAIEQGFRKWQSMPGKTFEFWYDLERRGYADALMEAHQQKLMRMKQHFMGQKLGDDDLLSAFFPDTISTLVQVATDAGSEMLGAYREVNAFLYSDAAFDAPVNDITALMLAALARKAASGQKRPPSAGMWNDIRAVSACLPYCDVMFLDNECAGLMREEPVAGKLERWGTKVFSAKTGEEFLRYLQELEAVAGADHVARVADVYGDSWTTPYRELFAQTRARS